MSEILKDFILPTADDYNDLIEGLNDDVDEEGGARPFLHLIRSGRSNSAAFDKTLHRLAHWSLASTRVNKKGMVLESERAIPNTMLSGMIFGHVVNEASYPRLRDVYKPYDVVWINQYILGEDRELFHEMGGPDTALGRRLGYRAMSNLILSHLDNSSMGHVESWSMDLIQNPALRQHFVDGFGLSLYAAWDLYSEELLKGGQIDYADLNINSDPISS